LLIWTSETQVMAKRKAGSQIASLTPNQKKSGIDLIYLVTYDVQHTVGKLSKKVTTLLRTSSQLKVSTQSYRPPKLWKSQFWEFQDSHLGVLEQNDIWVVASWLGTKNTIRGKVVASFKSRPWWVLWVRVCLWFVCAPKVLQLHTNQLIIWFVQVHVNNWPTCHSS
jgi:hypothetical protein